MRLLVLLSPSLLLACAGPTQQQMAETPTAQSRPIPAEAPPASTSDKDRERSVQQFDDMQATQRAREEARPAPPPPPPAGTPAAPAPKKKGPAVQGTLPAKSK
jgi:hypothetical protein